MKPIVTLAFLWMSFAFSPFAIASDDFATGLDAFNRRDYTTAMIMLERAALENVEIAQELVGQFYSQGKAAPKDPYLALYWYSRAGKYADNNVVVKGLEEQGYTLPETDVAALDLFKKQAASGDVSARYRVGMSYLWGRGTKQNFELAHRWLLSAAEGEHAYAQYEVARAHYNGQGVSKNLNKAMNWMKRAADNGVVYAQYQYGKFHRTGKYGVHDPATARVYFEAAAIGGYSLAQFEYVQFLIPEAITSELRIEAAKWLFLATNYMKGTQRALVRTQLMAEIKGLTDFETMEAGERARKFIRGDG